VQVDQVQKTPTMSVRKVIFDSVVAVSHVCLPCSQLGLFGVGSGNICK
jgi:hypothetical protein